MSIHWAVENSGAAGATAAGGPAGGVDGGAGAGAAGGSEGAGGAGFSFWAQAVEEKTAKANAATRS